MLTIYYAGDFTHQAGSLVHVHQHVWGQLEWIEAGRLLLLTGEGEQLIEAGDAVWIAPEYPHGWRALSPVQVLTFKFEWPAAELAGAGVRSLRDDVWLQDLPRRAMETWQSSEPNRRRSADRLIDALISSFCGPSDDGNAPGVIHEVEAKWTALLEELRQANGPALSLRDMARLTHLSPAHFRRLFEARYAITPGMYQTTQRLERANGLLRYTHLSVAQIAQQVGYADVSAFSKAFLRHFGCRPSSLRSKRAEV